MRTTRRSLDAGLALCSLGAVLVSIGFAVPACSSSGSNDAPVTTSDGGEQDGAIDAIGTQDGAVDGGVDPSSHADPQDLDPTSGDPSLDIAASWIYFDNNQPWVRVQFYGTWPPPATLSYWSCSVSLGPVNAPAVTYLVRSLGGTQTDSVDCNGAPSCIDKTKITFAAEPNGFRVLFADATLAFDHYGLECNVKKTNTGTLVTDTSGSFEVKNKEQRPFGP